VSLYLYPQGELNNEARAILSNADIEVISGISDEISVNNKKVIVCNKDGCKREYDSLYVLLGEERNVDLARQIGAGFTEAGQLIINDHQATTVAGLYAAGDVVSSLHQISVAIGQAAIAAAHIHNRLPPNFC
jgi:thioredoxin reductase (NADPH)